MNRAQHDSLFELYIAGGLELMTLGSRGCQRELIIDLETSALTPEMGDIIHFYAVNRFDPDDQFDEWVKPPRPLSPEAEQMIGKTNDRLAHCRPMQVALTDFLDFIEGAKLIGDSLEFDLDFLRKGISMAISDILAR